MQLEKLGMPIKSIWALTILVAWELWKERNARIYQRRHSASESLVVKIKEEVRTSLAGAKRLKEILPRESPLAELFDFLFFPHFETSILCLNLLFFSINICQAELLPAVS